MYKRFFAISIFMLFSLSIASDRNCEGLPQDDCEWLDYCMWTEDGCVRVGEDDGDWEDDENWEDECRFIEDIEECLEVGCEWDEEDGCFDPDSFEDDDWNDEESYCEELSQDECTAIEGCMWTEDGCVRVGEDDGDWEDDENWEDECRYFESEDECLAAGCQWGDEDGCYSSWNDDGDDEEDWEFECEDIDNQEECLEIGCEWNGSPNMPGGYCSGEWDEDDEEDWEFECEDIDNEEECLEIGCEWNGFPNMPGGYCSGEWDEDDEEDNEDWECSDLGYEECVYYDFCDWISDSDNPAIGNGYCIDTNDEDGPPECVMDCEGIENVDPNNDATYFCEWLLSIFPTGCAEDCEQEVLDDIEQFMIICDQCLADSNCDDAFDDDESEGCQDSTGQWYDVGSEMFVNDCEYYECTEEGWEGPFNLDNNECSDNNDWECSDLGFEECLYYDFCEWVSEPNIGWEGSCVDAGGWDPEAAVILGNGSSAPGGEVQIPLFLESSAPISGIQFTLNADPSDWQTVVDFNVMVSTDNCFEADFNNTASGTIGLIYSLSGCEFSPSDENYEIGSITFEISEYAEWGGVIELYFTELIVASSNGSQVDAESYGGLISIGALGDVNHDGQINVIDAVAIIQFVLQFEEPTDSDFWAGDINADGVLNILDVVLLVDMILSN